VAYLLILEIVVFFNSAVFLKLTSTFLRQYFVHLAN
jgi:hypothetical protein